jgi:succinate dehydrogenase/fumarate reductase cytochrome b subunit
MMNSDARATTLTKTKFWATVQGASGLFFSVFLVAHLATHTSAVFGPVAHDRLQSALRVVYQHPLVEPLVFGAIAMHLIASWLKPAPMTTPVAAGGWKRPAHILAGYVLMLIIIPHTLATRFLSPSLSFDGLAAVLHHVPGGFYLYFGGFALAGIVHMCLSLPKAVAQTRHLLGPFASAAKRVALAARSPVTWVTAVALTFMGIAALGGWLYPITLNPADPFAQHFRHTNEAAFRLLGLWRD